jgi:LytS/YehU family sensor histidine kinase
MNKQFSYAVNIFCFILNPLIILHFCAFPIIFSKNVKPITRLLMVFTGGVIGSAAGILFVKALLLKGMLVYPISMLFFIINILSISIIIGFLYYWEGIEDTTTRIQEERIKQLDMEKQFFQTRIKLIQSQIEPGFLFNTLKHVLSLLDFDLEKAKSLQIALIQYLRLSLSKLKTKSHTIGQEMSMIQSYLDILKEHPDNHLDFEIDIPDGLKKIKIPPMLIHAVVEIITNYIHKSSEKKSLISFLGIEKTDDLRFEVTATGLKNDKESHMLQRFQNLQERFDELFGDKVCLLLKHNSSDNLKIILKIRLEQSA